jgi:hypothetical protein
MSPDCAARRRAEAGAKEEPAGCQRADGAKCKTSSIRSLGTKSDPGVALRHVDAGAPFPPGCARASSARSAGWIYWKRVAAISLIFNDK